jgi:dihydrofolate synthase/folylpolyglutamate synthase
VPRALDAALGHPVRRVPAILIGGTNGKGSTSALLEALLRGAGRRVGLFTSPHLVSFRERIRVDGEDIAEADVARLVGRVLDAAESDRLAPSFFEAAWAMAAVAFAEAELDFVIWEVGLGGRLDATNVCDPIASAVVSVALDHTHVLGDTIEAIAAEKAAIFRTHRPALTAAQGDALRAVQDASPSGVGAVPPYTLGPLPLPGAHQRRNAGLALAIADAIGVPVDPADFARVRWPGRGERFGDVILDCAHNPDAVDALVDWLDDRGVRDLHLVFGATTGHDVQGMAAALHPMVSSVALPRMAYPRGLQPAAHLSSFPSAAVHDTVADAIEQRPSGRPTLVTGSCFLVGEARAHLTGQLFPERGITTTAR